MGLHKEAGRWIGSPEEAYRLIKEELQKKQVPINEIFWEKDENESLDQNLETEIGTIH